MNKSFNGNPTSQQISEQELALINRFTRKELSADDVYAFNVILCDNEIDRDGERFDLNSLQKLKELFVGVTGVFDHIHSGKNQTSRIFDTEVIIDENKMTSFGEKYCYLQAKAYMPKTQNNENLIQEIDAGIKKEVSVCCSVSSYICSICGNDMRSEKCSHAKGVTYSGKTCHCILSEPVDAYEWSFVAVPAQVGAGVVKSHPKKKVTKTFSECQEAFKSGEEITISKQLSKQLGEKLTELEALAADGKEYRGSLVKEAVKYASLTLKGIDGETIKKMCQGLEISKLKALRDSFFDKANEVLPLKPQLSNNNQNKVNNNEFIF